MAALLDITNTKTVVWLKNKLSQLKNETGDDVVFYIDTGNTFHTPHYFSFNSTLNNPDLYKEHFISACMDVVKVIGVSGASSKRPKAPAFVWMSHVNSSWEGLQTIIPNMLHLGLNTIIKDLNDRSTNLNVTFLICQLNPNYHISLKYKNLIVISFYINPW